LLHSVRSRPAFTLPPRGSEPSPAIALFLSSGPLLAVIIWLQKDAERTGVGTVQDWGHFLLLAWPVVIPWGSYPGGQRPGRDRSNASAAERESILFVCAFTAHSSPIRQRFERQSSRGQGTGLEGILRETTAPYALSNPNPLARRVAS
jgi:hypothetical protein